MLSIPGQRECVVGRAAVEHRSRRVVVVDRGVVIQLYDREDGMSPPTHPLLPL